MADPFSFEAFEDVRFASGYTIKPFLATRADILWAIDQHYHLGSSLTNIVKDIADERMVEVVGDHTETDGRDVEDLRKKSEAAPVIRMVNLIIAEAAEKGASDIHIEPVKTALQIRNRIDGLLTKTMDLPEMGPGSRHFAGENHGEDGHRREAASPGRAHRRPDRGEEASTCGSPRSRPTTGKRWSSGSSTPPTRPSRSTPWG